MNECLWEAFPHIPFVPQQEENARFCAEAEEGLLEGCWFFSCPPLLVTCRVEFRPLYVTINIIIYYYYSSYLLKNGSLSRYPQRYEAAQLFSTLIIIISVSCAANQNIRLICEDHVTLRLEEWCWKFSFTLQEYIMFEKRYSNRK